MGEEGRSRHQSWSDPPGCAALCGVRISQIRIPDLRRTRLRLRLSRRRESVVRRSLSPVRSRFAERRRGLRPLRLYNNPWGNPSGFAVNADGITILATIYPGVRFAAVLVLDLLQERICQVAQIESPKNIPTASTVVSTTATRSSCESEIRTRRCCRWGRPCQYRRREGTRGSLSASWPTASGR